jgi:2-keto-4-pentenoate hydratase/2-oxohepta-3-ene-1,7-dioic acid hydratase in catechol pathway
LCGPQDDIVFPPGAERGDWEVELGVIIGRPALHLPDPRTAADVVAGYLTVNDVSERTLQLDRGGQWARGKSYPTWNPAGPYLVTPDEAGDIGGLALELAVNGEARQSGTTADMVFDPLYIVWYLSQFLQLEPGDLINTGTPAGVGLGMKPDEITARVGKLGEQRNRVRIPPADGQPLLVRH